MMIIVMMMMMAEAGTAMLMRPAAGFACSLVPLCMSVCARAYATSSCKTSSLSTHTHSLALSDTSSGSHIFSLDSISSPDPASSCLPSPSQSQSSCCCCSPHLSLVLQSPLSLKARCKAHTRSHSCPHMGVYADVNDHEREIKMPELALTRCCCCKMA